MSKVAAAAWASHSTPDAKPEILFSLSRKAGPVQPIVLPSLLHRSLRLKKTVYWESDQRVSNPKNRKKDHTLSGVSVP